MAKAIAEFLDKGGAAFNVKAYGATGDGTTDDTAAIVAARDAAIAAGAESITLPAGGYVVDADTDLSSIELVGDGAYLVGHRALVRQAGAARSRVGAALNAIKDGRDFDGVAVADLDGDGKLDVVACESVTGVVYWYQQGANPYTWTEHTIMTGLTKPEGVAVGDYDGDGENEVIVLDQNGWEIHICKPATFGDPTGLWNTAVLVTSASTLAKACQDALTVDLDGDGRPECIYAHEGKVLGEGGVRWLDYDGAGSVLDPANWTNHLMIQHEGAWWLASELVDLDGDGDTDLVFGSRNNNNTDAVPGIYWLARPATVTDPWTITTIENRVADWLHVDVGDFSGDGTGKDVIGYDTDHTYGPGVYRHSTGWTRTDLPDFSTADRAYNIKRARLTNGPRDDILYIVENDGCYLLRYDAGEADWVERRLFDTPYEHPMDDKILFVDIDGDGIDEAVIPDSGVGTNRLVWVEFPPVADVEGVEVHDLKLAHVSDRNEVSAKQTVAQTLAAGWNKITLDTVDRQGTKDEMDTASSEWTPTASGWYLMSGAVRVAAAQPDGNKLQLTIWEGASKLRTLGEITAGAANSTTVTGTTLLYLTAGLAYTLQVHTGASVDTAPGGSGSPESVWLTAVRVA